MIKRDFSHTWKTPTGLEVKADIPPYVWMYNRGTIDIDVSDARECDHRVKTPFTMDLNSPEELIKWLEELKIAESDCKICKAHIIHRESEYRQADECDICCKERLSAEWAVENAQRAKEEAAEEQKMVKKGYFFKTVAWVHPSRGGDDYMMVWFSVSKPTVAQVQKILKKEGSRVMDDYGTKDLRTGKVA
jgi:hypothetical protein